jgi:hypothetical protein
MKNLLIISETALLFIGGLGLLWGIVCFLGGPDGKFGSLEAFCWSIGYLVLSTILLYGRKRIRHYRLIKFSKIY